MDSLVMDLVRLLLTDYIHPTNFGSMMLVSKRFYNALSDWQKSERYLKMWHSFMTIKLGAPIVTRAVWIKLVKRNYTNMVGIKWKEEGDVVILDKDADGPPDVQNYIGPRFGGSRKMYVSKSIISKNFRFCPTCRIVHNIKKTCRQHEKSIEPPNQMKYHKCERCGWVPELRQEMWKHYRTCPYERFTIHP